MAASVENTNTNANPKTLCDWVKNFRIKKIQMKRKLRSGGDLRVCAILTTALLNAEEELRRKQQERFHRWTEMQSKYGYFNNKNNHSNDNTYYYDNNSNYNKYTISNSSCASEVRREYYTNNNSSATSNIKVSENRSSNDDTNIILNSRQDITDLWKYELSGLDQFMKNMSGNNSCSVTN